MTDRRAEGGEKSSPNQLLRLGIQFELSNNAAGRKDGRHDFLNPLLMCQFA